MEYKRVKTIKDPISVLGIGCWNFGGDWDTSDERQDLYIIREAVESGINLFDVAPVYGFFFAEQLLGKALKEVGRHKVLIASKGGLCWNQDRTRYKRDLSAAGLRKEIEGSLKRLSTDYIDIYQMHWPDHNAPIEETAGVLKEFLKEGKIRYVGLSNHSKKDTEEFLKYLEVGSLQALYNMFERNSDIYFDNQLEYRTEKELLPIVKERGMAFFPYSPLMQGLLAGKFLDGAAVSGKDIRKDNLKLFGSLKQPYYEAALKVRDIAEKIGHPMNEVALNWLRQKEEVTSIIGGVSSLKQLRANIKALEWTLEDDIVKELDGIGEHLQKITGALS